MLGPPRIRKTQTLLGKFFLKLMGWKVEGGVPNLPKFIVLFAPHTSGWDLPLMLAVTYVFGIKGSWFGKQEIFHWPFGSLLKRLGGIPITRSSQLNTVQQTTQMILECDQIIIGISPEGTRSKSNYWKTGFYYIAHEAKVPILLAYLDYERKVGGFGPVMETTGDIETDMQFIRKFYNGITAKHPEKAGRITIKPQTVR